MRIIIKTKVEQDYRSVWQGFDEDLFKALKPPLMPLELVRFDGSHKGDLVHLRVGPFKQGWVSEITEQGESEDEIYFIDEGRTLPFPLKTWRHHHRIQKAPDGGSFIIDDFSYTTPTLLTDWLFYPLLYAQFAARGPVYRQFFKNKNPQPR